MLTESEIILLSLLKYENYFTKALPYLEASHFPNEGEKVVFNHIKEYHEKYQRQTNINTLIIDISNDKKLTDIAAEQVSEVLNKVQTNYDSEYEYDWLIDVSQEYCRSVSTYNVISEAMGYHNTPNYVESLGGISAKLDAALAFGFDDGIGHDYLSDFESRYEYYTSEETKIPFGLESFNRISNNGLPRKTLNLVLAGPHVGKTGMMCKWAADHLKNGVNVLYISLEMEEFKIAQRIDSNLLGFPINDLENGRIDPARFRNKIMEMRKQTIGRLMIKQMEGANVNHIKAYLKDLKAKENFVPDVIYVDYMGILNSTKASLKNHNSYTVLKSVSEELRGMAISEDVIVVSAAQFNRNAGQDPDMDDISESYGIAMTADFLVGLTKPVDEELEGIFVKVIKSRYSNKDSMKTFRLGFDPETVNYYDTSYNDNKSTIQPDSKGINTGGSAEKGFNRFKFNK